MQIIHLTLSVALLCVVGWSDAVANPSKGTDTTTLVLETPGYDYPAIPQAVRRAIIKYLNKMGWQPRLITAKAEGWVSPHPIFLLVCHRYQGAKLKIEAVFFTGKDLYLQDPRLRGKHTREYKEMLKTWEVFRQRAVRQAKSSNHALQPTAGAGSVPAEFQLDSRPGGG